jgi:DUF1365 family protein
MRARRDRRADLDMNSCLYECTVMHHRLAPKQHRFSYRIFMFYLDLDELDAIAARTTLFRRNRAGLFAFNDADHLDDSGGSTKDKLLGWLGRNGIALPWDARIMLLTLPRVFGYVFNPVSFYFCFDAAGAPACAVAEVGNTFGEKKLYLLPELSNGDRFRLVTPKNFYVSPFSELDLDFDFKLRIPSETLEVHVDDRLGDQKTLLAALTGRRAPLTAGRLGWFTIKYPFITLWVITLIHWNALLLWLKRVPFHRKEARPKLQRDVLHPHASLQELRHES